MVLWSDSFIECCVSSMISNYILNLDYENYISVGTNNAWEPCKWVLVVLMCLHEG